MPADTTACARPSFTCWIATRIDGFAPGFAPGFAEDGFVGRSLRIGERAIVAILDRDPRCKMIALDPDTAALDGDILKCVGQGHEGRAGVYGAVLVEGTVRPDDPVVCLD